MGRLTVSNALTGATIVGACALVAQLVAVRAPVTPSTRSYIPRALGKQVDFAVHRRGERSEALASAGGATCRYVVVVSPSCGASAELIRTWNRGSPETLHLPAGWSVLWLSAGDEQSMAPVLSKEFPFTVYYPAQGTDVLNELGVDAVPTHLVLDRTGRLVSGDVGAVSPEPSRLRPDCSIAPDPSPLPTGREITS